MLILTASIGEGHDLPARTLAAQLRAEAPLAEVEIVDCMPALGRLVGLVSESAPRVVFYRFTWLWDVGFWAFARCGPTRRLFQSWLERLGAPGLVRLVREHGADVVVSVYPHSTEILGRLRARGELGVPVVAAITDIAALDYWATPGADVHLITHPESADEVRAVAGADARVRCVHGLTSPEFREPRAQEAARRRLGLREGKVVAVSGGGWGVGDLAGAVEAALGIDAVAQVVVLCGRNETLAAGLEQRFAGDGRVRVEGFTDAMPQWLAAVDVLVHSTGGLTVLEAVMSGCPVVSYGWGRGHVRVHNEAYGRYRLAEVASTPRQLGAALAIALARGRRPADAFTEIPSAASVVLELVAAR